MKLGPILFEKSRPGDPSIFKQLTIMEENLTITILHLTIGRLMITWELFRSVTYI